MIFLDTNVISETLKKAPDQAVIAWLVRYDAELALPAVAIAEIAYGPIMKRCLDFKIERGAMPNLERWMAGIAARPAFKAATA